MRPISGFMGKVGVPLTGTFTNVQGTSVHIEAGAPQPLTDADLTVPKATSSPLLLSDKLPGARVLSVE
jgi:hypothetical protein